MSAIWVTVIETRGSAPRDAGTAMRVTEKGIEGTIGGGALEHEAIALARDLLAKGSGPVTRRFALGPGLGQCCGGAVTLGFSDEPGALDPVSPVPALAWDRPIAPLWIWGAGHVGRAVVDALPPGAFAVTWLDTAPERFPEGVPNGVTPMPGADLPLLAKHAPCDALHLIFTYSHEIDLALCAALLRRKARFIGLIGSTTKRTRFFKRLRSIGLDPTSITCPIGDKALGKAPAQIAAGTLVQLAGLRAPLDA